MPRKPPVHKCSRKKFNALYKAELQAAYAGGWRERAVKAGFKPRKWDRDNILIQARRRATAACGGDPLYGCPDTAVGIERVRLDSGGYDKSGGQYFGRGAPVFRVYSDRGTSIPETMRAGNMAAAKAALRKKCPGIKFER